MVTEWYPSLLKDPLPEKMTFRDRLQATLRARERTTELARRLATAMPDKKVRLEQLFAW